jgi:hypothetical protein
MLTNGERNRKTLIKTDGSAQFFVGNSWVINEDLNAYWQVQGTACPTEE